MEFKDITEKNKDEYNRIITHPLQTYAWGEFRKKTGIRVIRRGLFNNEKIVDGFTLTLHKIPKTKFTVGYLPKGNSPTEEVLSELKRIGKENNCIFIQLEPNLIDNHESSIMNHQSLTPAAHPLFTKYTFILDITKSEEELLKKMHPKTRYNIKVAQKSGVKIIEDNSKNGFEAYLQLMEETTSRQQFYAHTPDYHRKLWETLEKNEDKNELSYHLLHAVYKEKIITSWVLFVFQKTLYYPYGASSRDNREVMASNLLCWEAIKFGEKLGLTKFDMWGALGPNPDKKDPWYGFHRFKEGYGAELTEFVGSYDLVINPVLHQLYKIADKLRWILLRIKNFH